MSILSHGVTMFIFRTTQFLFSILLKVEKPVSGLELGQVCR